MLSKAEEKLIRSLKSRKGREKSGKCLVEGVKAIETAGKAVEFVFTREDTTEFNALVTTETPQDEAAVARIPEWGREDIDNSPTLVVLDGVQDPGNVGAVLRLCLGFGAALLLVESVDVSSPKVIRSSAGAMFQVPWTRMSPSEAAEYIAASDREVFRLERQEQTKGPETLAKPKRITIIAGSEGSGIRLPNAGTSIEIPHDEKLESLNVTHALAIALYQRG
ncbi:MAG: RNA methyltransferase [Patescibacteria group bacterium]|nr:RNA methyltransferase [Patescibacteria group bacterium]